MKKIVLLFVICLSFCSGLRAQREIPPPPPVPVVGNEVAKQDSTLNLANFIKEIQIQGVGANKVEIAWWIPWQYMDAALKSNGSHNAAADSMVNSFKNFTLIYVIDGKVDKESLAFKYRSENEIRKSIQININDSIHLQPISESRYEENLQILLSVLTPALEKNMGALGEHMCFFVFKNTNDAGNYLVDASKKGKLSVSWIESSSNYSWSLPLDILTPPKFCPVDGEKLSGKYMYCPYHGNKLNNKK